MINITKTKDNKNSLGKYLKKKFMRLILNRKLYLDNYYITTSIDSSNFWLRI